MGVLVNIIPVIIGFIAKLMAIKSQAATNTLNIAIEGLAAKENSIKSAREVAAVEGPGAKWFRRFMVTVLLALVTLYVVLPPLLDISLVIPVETTKEYLFGLFGTSETEFKTVQGLYKFEEIFAWTTMVLEFYFGAQIAKV